MKFFLLYLLIPGVAFCQGKGIAPSELLKPLQEEWPTYNGDYSGRRFSALKQVNSGNVKNLSLAWMTRFTPGDD